MKTWRGFVEQPPHFWIAVLAGVRIVFWLALGAPTSPAYSQLVLLTVVLTFSAASALLVWGGREREPRALALALSYLLVATTYTNWGTRAMQQMAGPVPFAMRLLQPAAFLPFAIWTFCSSFPRAPQFPAEIRRLARIRFAAYAVGIVLFLVNLVPYGVLTNDAAPGGAALLAWLNAASPSRGFWRVIGLASLPAVIVAALRTRRAPVDERRRVSLLLFAIVVGGMPPLLLPLVVLVVPGMPLPEDPTASLVYSFIEYGGLFLLLLVSGYAILARRALDVRFIVRRTIQYALARNVVLGVTALPFVALTLVAYQNRERAIGELFASADLAVLLGFTLTGVALARFRLAARLWIDRMFFREQYDARRILAALVEPVRDAPDAGTIARLCAAEIDRALHVERVALLHSGGSRPFFVSTTAEVRPLAADSGLLQRLRDETAPVDIQWDAQSELVTDLPAEDRRWLADADFRLLLPLHGRDRQLVGVLGLGEKRSELPYSREDRDLLVAIAGAAALALENRMLVRESEARRAHPDTPGLAAPASVSAPEPVGRVCRDCGIIQQNEHRCEHCAGTIEDGEYPLVLAGKYQLMERIGRGGMGIVFRARDRALGRDVAIKTLPAVSAARSARLRREARAMAAVSHPNLAVILAAEVWRGTPYLVVEYLPGGTLADRLRKAPLDEQAAIALGLKLASVLERVHAAGILHRDIKPGNIGYAQDDTPKLLDFGLARLVGLTRTPHSATAPVVAAHRSNDEPGITVTRQDAVVGTVLYLSPESLSGAPAEPSFDLWSSNVVLYECVAGRHPFAGPGEYAVIANIAARPLPDIRSFQPQTSSALAAYFDAALARDMRRRPKSAREIRDRLQALGRSPALHPKFASSAH